MQDQVMVLLGVICTCIAAVQHAKIKYGNTSDVSKLIEKVETLSVRVEKMEKDRLRERVSRLETSSGLDIFK